MNFVAYVIAWFIITCMFGLVASGFNKFINFIRERTPLGKSYRQRREEEYKKIAHYVASEIAETHFMIKEFERFHPELNEDVVEEKEGKE